MWRPTRWFAVVAESCQRDSSAMVVTCWSMLGKSKGKSPKRGACRFFFFFFFKLCFLFIVFFCFCYDWFFSPIALLLNGLMENCSRVPQGGHVGLFKGHFEAISTGLWRVGIGRIMVCQQWFFSCTSRVAFFRPLEISWNLNASGTCNQRGLKLTAFQIIFGLL